MSLSVSHKPRLLDLFCGAGGSAMGYHRAGFEVVGVDIKPQPNYPFDHIEGDALSILRALIDGYLGDPALGELDDFAAIHASCPCQWATAYGRRPNHVKECPNLIAQTRALLEATGLPYVIENVEQARAHLLGPIMLCGSSFRHLDVRRHRLFECSFSAKALPCDHPRQTPRFPQATNRTNLRSTVEVGVWRIPLEVQQRAMGIDWMTLEELSQAIPPAYTVLIGHYLLQRVRALAREAA